MTSFRQSKKSGRSALWVVAGLLILSATVRQGIRPGAAIARELGNVTAQNASQAASIESDIAPELVRMMQSVKERESKLRLRETEIEARLNVLSLVETEVKQDIARLEKAEADLRATIAVANQAAESDIARLTAVYENMKSEEAAALFQRMEPSFAAGFLGRMRADAAAAILAGLEPDLAYSISIVLAGRNADVPVESAAE